MRDLRVHLIHLDSSLVGFGLGTLVLLVEGKEVSFLSRKGDLDQTPMYTGDTGWVVQGRSEQLWQPARIC